MSSRLLVTIDVEALPGRADRDHVSRLIWGQHAKGRAGIVEICEVLEAAGGIGLFFLEVAGSLDDLAAYREVNSFLVRRGHLVEWHFHPEILSRKFWRSQGASGGTMRQDLFDARDARVILQFGLEQFRKITGRNPRAYRAGSFRWNEHVIEFLGENAIPYSFNACAETAVRDNFVTFEPESPRPFKWSNGVIELPCGEVRDGGEIIHFRFPRQFPKSLPPDVLARHLCEQSGGPVQLLLHSWSLLSRDEHQNFVYVDDSKWKFLSRTIQKLAIRHSLPTNASDFFSAIDQASVQDTVNLVDNGGVDDVD